MKILLIQPNPQFTIAHILPRYISEESGIYPPLGLLYLASSVEQQCNAEVQILDNAAQKLDSQQLKRKIQLYQPQLVGISVTSFTLLESLEIARQVKSIDKGIHVCLGGPHPTIFPEETVRFSAVNSVVIGEGELTFPEMVNHLNKGLDLREVAGVVYKDRKGEIHKNRDREFISNLDTLPFPARHLVSAGHYRSIIGEKTSFTTMVSSRGCLYNCSFCYHSLGKRCRCHSTEYMLQEIDICRTQGYREFWYFDDNFITSRQRILDFCHRLIRTNSNICWHARTRFENLNQEIIERMADAGCKRISIGVESASPRILKTLRKETDLSMVRQKIGWLKSTGIKTYLDFIIGSPGETLAEIRETIDFARDTDPDYVQFALLIPYPQTDLYLQALKDGTYQKDAWQEFAQSPGPDFLPPLANENIKREDLIKLVGRAYRKFYWRPKYIIKNLLAIKSIKDLLFKSKAALRLIVHRSPW